MSRRSAVATCPTDRYHGDDYIALVKRPAKISPSPQVQQALDELWGHSRRTAPKRDKKCAFRWAANVRSQYEPARRAIRILRWRDRPRFENPASSLFYEEAAKWKEDTMHWSSVTRMIAHHSYLRIIGLGREFKQGEIEELLLKELEAEPDYWFDALTAITGDNPVRPEDDFDESVNAWLEWGRSKGILAA